jgi:hypothetical protein
MIRIGLSDEEKRREITAYIEAHGIEKTIVFFWKAFPLQGVEGEHREYTDIIMYKYFYRLLEEIDERTLLVFNECLRAQNRSDLTYNCAHHYANQTPHVIVFEYFPFIEHPADFMILLDLMRPNKYKGKGFSPAMLADEDVLVKPHPLTLETLEIETPAKAVDQYEAKKEQLFANIGEGDPDTIPRQLHVWAGNLKKAYLKPNEIYVARNSRFKLPNVATYKTVNPGQEYIVIDFPHRRLDFNDFLKVTGIKRVRFLHSELKVDKYYADELQRWIERRNAFYGQASLYPEKRV